MRKRRKQHVGATIQQFIRQRTNTDTIPKKLYAPVTPYLIKYFHPHRPYRPRLSVTLEDIKSILLINTSQAQEVIQLINAKPYKSKLPFITVKELARFMKVPQWQIQHYFITCEFAEYAIVQARHRRKKY